MIKKRKGRRNLQDYRHEHNTVFGYLYRQRRLRQHVLNLEQDVFTYVNRYKKESGF